jgi:hypothetical protein
MITGQGFFSAAGVRGQRRAGVARTSRPSKPGCAARWFTRRAWPHTLDEGGKGGRPMHGSMVYSPCMVAGLQRLGSRPSGSGFARRAREKASRGGQLGCGVLLVRPEGLPSFRSAAGADHDSTCARGCSWWDSRATKVQSRSDDREPTSCRRATSTMPAP